jgi:hypothetical protein
MDPNAFVGCGKLLVRRIPIKGTFTAECIRHVGISSEGTTTQYHVLQLDVKIHELLKLSDGAFLIWPVDEVLE